MEKAPPVIHEFSTEIYPFRLWVCISKDLSVLDEWFVNASNGDKLAIKKQENGVATTIPVKNKKTNDIGVVIMILDKRFLDFNTAAHESSHAANIFWGQIGESECGEEANAYLIGWIAQCIEQTKNHKTK